MNVYVESNFVLEQALEQEQCESCEELVRLASSGSVHLVIPAFSLAEPHITLTRKENERSQLASQLKKQLSDLGRSRAYRKASGSFNQITDILIRSAESERAGLERATAGMLKTAEVIPLNSDVFQRAGEVQIDLDMSAQDAIVLASVVWHLTRTKPPESCFLNRNTKDFDDPNVREILDNLGCRFFGRFDDGLRYVEAALRRSVQ